MSFDLKVVNGDLVIGSSGNLTTVVDSEKLIQDLLKIAITELGSNQFFPWYGSPIGKTLIGSAFDHTFISSIATNQLRSSVENLKDLQSVQAKSSQSISAAEHIGAIKDILIDRDISDPRLFTVFLSVVTKALTVVDANFRVTL